MYNICMGFRYRNSREFVINRQNHIFLQKLRRKGKKYILYKASKPQNFRLPLELKLMGKKGKRDVNNVYRLPECFSLTDDPSKCISVLKDIAKVFIVKKDLNLQILCNKTKLFDLSALILLSSIIVKGERYLSRCGYSCTIKGDYPTEKKSRDLFIYSGLPKHLNCIDPKDKEIEILDPFATIKQTNDESSRIVEYYNSCLNKNGLQLNELGKVYFYNLVNEVIDNALLHSGYKNVLYCGGYYNNIDKSIQISIINYGNSMYESLANDSSPFTKKKLDNFTNKYKKIFDLNYNKENLWTLLALQYKVSRFSEDEKSDRGTGTVKFIEAFLDVGNTFNEKQPRVSLTSGNTSIIFDGEYRLQDSEIDGQCVKIISFNKENDLSKRPDSRYVKNIDSSFPGVAINLEIFIDADYLTNGGEKRNDN